MQALLSLNKYLYRYKSTLIFGLFLVFCSNIFNVFPAQIIRNCIDLVVDDLVLYKHIQGYNSKLHFYTLFKNVLFVFGLTIVGLALLKGFLMFLMRQTLIVMSRKIEFDLKNDIYNKYQVLSMEFYKTHHTGDLMNRISEDVSRVRMYVGPSIMYAANMIVTLVLVLAAMFSVNVKLTFIVLSPLPILSYCIYLLNTYVAKKSELLQEQLSRLTTFTQEMYSGIKVIQSFALQKPRLKLFEQECESYQTKSLSLAKTQAFFSPLMMGLIGLSTTLLVYFGGKQVIAGELSAGNLAEFIIYIFLLTWPISSIGWVASMLQRAAVSQNRINEYLKSKEVISSNKNLKDPINGSITFDKVNFTYPHSGVQALKNLDLKINAGEKILILGKTGSGKSTIAMLMARMYDPQSGNIFIDKTNIKDYNVNFIRQQAAWVPQDVFLFSDTVKNNILFGCDNDNFDPAPFAKNAVIHNEIMALPNQYETMVGERGVTLSGGQKQRISIARALAKTPKILILDDCLSAVDTQTENQIQNAWENNMQNKTIIIISHRIPLEMNFNTIFYIENGMVIEQGNHELLMKEGGHYATLFQWQRGLNT